MRKDIYERMAYMKKEGIKPNYASVSRQYNCDYRTVKRYFESDETEAPKERKKLPSKLDGYHEIIADKLEDSCTFYSIYQYIKKQGFTGKYTIVRDFANKIKKDKITKATIRFETIPGLQAQVDWKESLTMISKFGEIFEVNIFLMLLGYSRLKFIKLTLNRTQDMLEGAMIEGFKYFNGVPHEIIFDNMRTVVDQSRLNYQDAVINQHFYQFSKDMGFEVFACRAYRPQTKGKVEALAKLMSRLKPYNNEFSSFDDLDTIVKMINDDINDEISQATGEKPSARYQKEKRDLLPLPNRELLDNYLTNPLTRKVSKEALITFQNNKYSLPPHYIGKTVTLAIRGENIDIFHNNLLVTTHEISPRRYNYHPEHYQEILKSDSMAHKSDDDIARLAEQNLAIYDNL